MDAFNVDTAGDFSVTYTVSGQAAVPFTIGIYGSQSGTSYQPVELLQTYPVTDPSLLADGTYTVTFAADLGQLDTNCYLWADLDVYNDVRQTTKADNVSSEPLSGVFQTADGSVYAFTPVGAADATNTVGVSQEDSGNVTVALNLMDYTFSSVSGVTIGTPTGNNDIDAAGNDPPATVPLTIYGGSGSDWIVGGDGGDTIYGGAAGGNTIQGGSGGNTIYGGAGGGDTIWAGSGGDTIYDGAAGGSTVHGGDGGDTIYGAADGGDTIYGGDGNDTITGQGTRSNTIEDVDGNDTIYAGSGGDTITAGNGNDQVFGGAGNDTISVGNGNDWVQGGGGNDSIAAGTGNDWLYGGASGSTVLRAGDIDSTTPMIVPAENDVMAGSGTGVVLRGQLLDSTGGLREGTVYYGDGHSATFSFYGSVFAAPSHTYAADGVYYASVDVTDADEQSPSATYTVIVEDMSPGDHEVGIVADKPDASKPEQTSGEFTVYWNGLTQAGAIVVNLGGPAVVGTDYQPVGTSGPVPSGDTGEVITLPVSAGSGSQTFEIDPVGPGTGAGDTLLLANVFFTGAQQRQSVQFDYGGDMVLSPSGVANEWQAVVAIHDPEAVPVVSITPVNQTPAPDETPADADAYANWQDSSQPIQIPIEGEGQPVEVNFYAALSQIYANASNWLASISADPAILFRTSPTATSSMTAAQVDAAIAAGNYTGDWWLSAAAGAPTNSTVTMDDVKTVGDVEVENASACVSTTTLGQQAASRMPIYYPFDTNKYGTSAVAYSSIVISDGTLRVRINDGPNYKKVSQGQDLYNVMSGVKSASITHDTDSAQFAVEWTNASGGIIGGFNTNALPQDSNRSYAANWTKDYDDTTPVGKRSALGLLRHAGARKRRWVQCCIDLYGCS